MYSVPWCCPRVLVSWRSWRSAISCTSVNTFDKTTNAVMLDQPNSPAAPAAGQDSRTRAWPLTQLHARLSTQPSCASTARAVKLPMSCYCTAAAAAATAQHTAHQTAQTLRLANAHGRRVPAGPQRSPAGSAACTLSATCRICAVTTLWKVRPGAFVSVASFGSSEPRQTGSVKLGPASDRSQCPSSPMRNGSSGESNSARTSAMRAAA